jgi:hypothetical protein
LSVLERKALDLAGQLVDAAEIAMELGIGQELRHGALPSGGPFSRVAPYRHSVNPV